MKAIRTLVQVIMVLALAGALFVTVPQVHATATTITVNTINSAADGKCSFVEAVQAANSNAAVDSCPAGSAETDIIRFHIHPDGSSQTITLSSQVTISAPIFIDGSSQPGYAGIPLIHVTGSDSYLLWFDAAAGGSTVKGIKFTNTYTSGEYGVDIFFDESSNNVVVGNYFNTDGTSSIGTIGKGISLGNSSVDGNSSNNVIGGSTTADRNYFGGLVGVEILSGSNNLIRGNYFGVKRGGNTKLTGLPVGIESAIIIGSSGTTATGNTVRGNVIGGFNSGLYLTGSSSDQTTIAGNKIGVGANGTASLGNVYGIDLVNSSNNIIGGSAAADRNVISGSSGTNIVVYGVSNNNVIQGNYVGTDAAGLHALNPATSAGIYLSGGSGNLIGGAAAGSGNVISGNQIGIGALSGATGTTILGNKIGTDKNGAYAIPNITGISLNNTSAAIGDAITLGNNLISGNTTGIEVLGTTGTTIYGNKVGTNKDGRLAIPNSTGIYLSGASVNIGDASTPGNNLISGNGNPDFYGIYILGSTGTTVYGNKFGLTSVGETAMPNGTAIALENGASATISGNWIGRSANDGVYVGLTSTVLTSSQNCFIGNTHYGVRNENPTSAPFPSNWWGDASGPTYVGNPGGTGDAIMGIVDYLVVLPSPPPACANLLQNASFEIDTNHDKKPDIWAYTNFDTLADKRDCTIRKAGTCSLKLVGNGLQKVVTQTILHSGPAGDDIGFGLWSKATSVPTGSTYRLQMRVYSGATLLATKTANFTVGTHGFQQKIIRYTAPGAYDKIVIKIVFTASSGTAWFDVAFLGWAP